MTVLGDAERILAQLYPYRWPIAVVAVVALAVLVRFAVRRGWHKTVRRHPRRSAALGLAALVVLVPLGWFLLSPLWTRVQLVEAAPLAAATGAPVAAVVASGEVRGADEFHFGEGTVRIVETAPGEHVLRFENFSVRNGPDLHVYLSPDPNGYAAAALDLGQLRATDGSFNQPIPAGTDLTRFRSVIVWCEPFSVLFASAPLVFA
jgi:hypothetical protein